MPGKRFAQGWYALTFGTFLLVGCQPEPSDQPGPARATVSGETAASLRTTPESERTPYDLPQLPGAEPAE
jgi:hypothetical protein